MNGGDSVWVIQNGKALKIPIETGLVGISDIEVLQGLSEGDVVIVRPDAQVREGRDVVSE